MAHPVQISLRRSAGDSAIVRGDGPDVAGLQALLEEQGVVPSRTADTAALAIPVGSEQARTAFVQAVRAYVDGDPAHAVQVCMPAQTVTLTDAGDLRHLLRSVLGSAPEMVGEEAAALTERVRALAPAPHRIMIGLAGVPGAGKSTLAALLAGALGAESIVVPLDGFHLSNRVLEAQGKAGRKGAIDTFDVAGYRALLERIRRRDEVVYAPLYLREYEETIAGSIAVDPSVRFVITEGNYLLAEGWEQIRSVLDAVWYVEVDDDVRIQRLVARHRQFGKSPDEATAWATGSDESNARLIRKNRGTADLIVRAG